MPREQHPDDRDHGEDDPPDQGVPEYFPPPDIPGFPFFLRGHSRGIPSPAACHVLSFPGEFLKASFARRLNFVNLYLLIWFSCRRTLCFRLSFLFLTSSPSTGAFP